MTTGVAPFIATTNALPLYPSVGIRGRYFGVNNSDRRASSVGVCGYRPVSSLYRSIAAEIERASAIDLLIMLAVQLSIIDWIATAKRPPRRPPIKNAITVRQRINDSYCALAQYGSPGRLCGNRGLGGVGGFRERPHFESASEVVD